MTPEERHDAVMDDLRRILGLREGRNVIRYFVEASGLRESCLRAEVHMMAHKDGFRSMGIHIERLVNEADPQARVTMLGEEIEEAMEDKTDE